MIGTPFGASPPYALGSEYYRTAGGLTNAFYDYAYRNGDLTGIELDTASVVNSIVFAHRAGFASRMIGGVFQGSNDGTNDTTLYTITKVPVPYTLAAIGNPNA